MIEATQVTSESMLQASIERTGLDDFGDAAFREGLDLLLLDVRALDLSPEFVAASAGRIGQSLDARAMAVAGLKKYPQVLAQPIKAPIIIAGLVRSGTTALHHLLSLDPQFQGPEHWLTVAPMPRPPKEQWTDVAAYCQIRDGVNAFIASAPEMAEDHMMSAEGIEESLFILATGFASNMWPSMWPVPNYDKWYQGRNDEASYRWMADVLRLIGKDDDRRWLLKNPTDLFSLEEVLTVFPDAKIIQTHRDPVEAMPSIASLIFAAQRVFCGEKADPWTIGPRESALWAKALERAFSVRRKRDASQFFDVEFKDFTRDQMSVVSQIYKAFDLVLTPETKARMQQWLDNHPRRKSSGTRYIPEDYGLSRSGLADQFQSYRAARGYSEA